MADKFVIGYSYRSTPAEPAAQIAATPYGIQTLYQQAPYQAAVTQMHPGYYQAAGIGGAAAAATPAAPPVIADPAWSMDAQTFGVLQRSDSIFSAFVNAKRGILDLRDGLKSAPSAREKALIERVADYVTARLTPAERAQFFGPFMVAGAFRLPDLDAIIEPGADVAIPGAAPTAPKVKENDHSALFRTARIVSGDIRTTDALRNGLSLVRRARQRALEAKQADLEVLEGADIPEAQAELAVLDRTKIEALGDYAVAQRLVAENWAAVEQSFADRRRVLENNLGLYYVKVRETPLGAGLPDPLDLRYQGLDDVVPGCAAGATELPEDLAPFLEAVLDIPVSDWASLRGLVQLLPGRGRIEALVQGRRQRLGLRLNQAGPVGGSRLALRLAPMRAQTLGLARDLLARPFAAAGALSQVQQQGSEVLSLEDLLSGPPNRLRAQATTLHERLDGAAACLQGRLAGLAPSLRLPTRPGHHPARASGRRRRLSPGAPGRTRPVAPPGLGHRRRGRPPAPGGPGPVAWPGAGRGGGLQRCTYPGGAGWLVVPPARPGGLRGGPHGHAQLP
jgi:hypothetical protein